MLRTALFFLIMFCGQIAFGQVAVLTDENQSLTTTLSAAPAATQPTYAVLWSGVGGPQDSVGSATGTTAKTMLTGLAGGPRAVEAVQIYNNDSAASTVLITKVVSGTGYSLISGTIPAGGVLRWSKTEGVKILDSQGVVATSSNGTVVSSVAATAIVTESGAGTYHRTTFTLVNMPLTIRDVTAPAQGGGQQIYDFPEGRIFILGATGRVTVTTTSVLASTLNASVSSRWGVGTVTQANVTLATTEQDILPVTTFTSSATVNVANTATNAALATAAQFDGTATAKDAFFNISIPTATDIDADATTLINGTLTIHWVFLGDY
jgi:hypothetical protein